MLYSAKEDELHNIIDGYSPSLVIDTIGEYDATMQNDAEVLVRIGIAQNAKKILEIGTSLGNTAKLLAHYFDVIYTLDNALDEFGGHGEMTGVVCRDINNVMQIIGDSLLPASYEAIDGLVDLVFVDDGHDYHHVVTNTFIAMQKIAPGGILVHHDTYWDSVMQGLTDLATVFDVWIVKDTYLAIVRPMVRGEG